MTMRYEIPQQGFAVRPVVSEAVPRSLNRHLPWRRLLCLAPLIATALAASAQNVVRCTDASGHATYQSQPCQGQTETKQLTLERGAPPADARTAKPQPATGLPTGTGLRPPSVPAAPPYRTEVSVPTTQAQPAQAGVRGLQPASPSAAQQAQVEAMGTSGSDTKLGEGADVLVVSGLQSSASSTSVHVKHTGRPVLLVLSTRTPTEWRVSAEPGTKLKAIIAAAVQSRPSVVAPAGVLVIKDSLPHAQEAGSHSFRQLLGQLNTRYGAQGITGFHGAVTLPNAVVVAGPYSKDPTSTVEGIRPEKASESIEFDLISTEGRRLPWTNNGPKDGKRYVGVIYQADPSARMSGGFRPMLDSLMFAGPLALDVQGQEAYTLGNNGHGLFWFPQGLLKPSKEVAVPKDLPELSWCGALAWSSQQGVLVIACSGSNRYIYRYDTRSQRWLGARPITQRLVALGVNAKTGGFVGLSESSELLLLGKQGEVIEVHALKGLLPDAAGASGGTNQGMTVAAEGHLVALAKVADATVSHIWTYDLTRRKAQLTYKAP